jgi:hypothetical protein
MNLKIRNGVIFNEDGAVIGALTPEFAANEQVERTIELGSDAIPEIEAIVSEINSGSFKPRSISKRLEKLIEKYPAIETT